MTTLSEIAAVLDTTEKNALARCKGLRILPVCSRCGGSGQYSFNGTHSNCYGCGGAGQVAPTASQLDDVLALAIDARNNGKLAEYKLYLDARDRSRNAVARIMDAWKATNISSAYRWQNAADYARTANPEHMRDRDIADINAKMADAYNTVSKAADKLNSKSATYQADVIAFAATVDQALETVAAADREFKAYLASH